MADRVRQEKERKAGRRGSKGTVSEGYRARKGICRDVAVWEWG